MSKRANSSVKSSIDKFQVNSKGTTSNYSGITSNFPDPNISRKLDSQSS